MTTVAALSAWMGKFAPLDLAESWDNVGLLWGDPKAAVERVMTCLTVTPATAEEAIAERAELIVSHHPVLFRPVQKITADRSETGCLWALARAGVAIYSPHTAFDNAEGGINDGLAARLALLDVRPLRPSPPRESFKVVAFCPVKDREPVLAAAFAAGAGWIGDYQQCSFSAAGRGTFLPNEGANPTIGRVGRRERVREWRVEVLCPAGRLAAVLAAMRKAHSYEEPAIDAVPVRLGADGPGAGRVGRLAAPMALGAFVEAVRDLLGSATVPSVGDPARAVATVAISCGAGDDFLKDAARAGADVLLTGEARFHRALEAESLGVALVLAGHHATERPGVEDLAGRLAAAHPGLRVWASLRERDPLRG